MSVKDYFDFTKTQRNGIIVIVSLIILILVGMKIYENRILYDDELIIESFSGVKDTAVIDLANQEKVFVVRYFKFNPNHISEDSLLLLGISTFASQNLIKYRSKGGVFYRKEDLKKVYGVSDSLFVLLEPYIDIPQKQVYVEKKIVKRPNTVKRLVIELNQADTNDLIRIRGVGTVFANRIIKYRNLLGGYVDKEQLKEVYGIDQVKYDEIKDWVSVSPEFVKKINVNKMNAEELQKHPYINYKEAGAIVGCRRNHGKFKTTEELLQISTIDENTYYRVLPYLGL